MMNKPENIGMTLLSPAKVNLFLKIIGKRPDGYHDLVTLMCPITLYDRISFTFTFETKKITITCSDPQIPQNESNLAYRAASCFLNTYPLGQGESVDIHISKQIPVSAGLGGGSSNAATVLLGLNQYCGYPFSEEKLLSMGLSIGADVPFFIHGKPTIARGIGEKLETFTGLIPHYIVLVFPGFGVPTSMVYANLNLALTNCKKTITCSVLKQRGFNAEQHLCNDLESVTASRYPIIFSIKESLSNHGAIGALMSGSGPTVYGLFSDLTLAQNAADAMSRNKKWQVFLVDMLL